MHTFCRKRDIRGVNLRTIQEHVLLGKLKPKENEMITMRDLVNSGIMTNPGEGIKILAEVTTLKLAFWSLLIYSFLRREPLISMFLFIWK